MTFYADLKHPHVGINFCQRCGKKLSEKDPNSLICENNHTTFRIPAPAVGVFFIDSENKIILSVRGINPGKGKLDCIGGFVNQNESFEDAILREIKEETGLSRDDFSTLKYICSAPNIYRFEKEDKPVVSVFFVAKLYNESKIKPSDDVAEIIIKDINEVNIDDFSNYDVKVSFSNLKKFLEKNDEFKRF